VLALKGEVGKANGVNRSTHAVSIGPQNPSQICSAYPFSLVFLYLTRALSPLREAEDGRSGTSFIIEDMCTEYIDGHGDLRLWIQLEDFMQ
jgi:hypothetical protein